MIRAAAAATRVGLGCRCSFPVEFGERACEAAFEVACFDACGFRPHPNLLPCCCCQRSSPCRASQ